MAAVVFATASGAPISPSSPSSEATARALLLNDDAPVTSLSEQLAALPTVTTCVARWTSVTGSCNQSSRVKAIASLSQAQPACGGVSGYRRRRRLEMEAGTRWIRHLLDLCTIALRDLSRKKEHILLARVAQLDE